MASINIEPPILTPAHEWASDATNALNDTSALESNDVGRTMSETSTPGSEFPGSFPHESRLRTQQPTTSEERTPHVAAMKLADAAPSKSVGDVQESARGYLPSVDVQRAVDAAKAYFPESVVGAVGSVLPAGIMNGKQTEEKLDPTLGAKPISASAGTESASSLNNNVSTTAIPTSTRATSSASDAVIESAHNPKAEIGNALDVTSNAKPDDINANTSTSDPFSGIPAGPNSTASPVPGASSETTPSPINEASAGTTVAKNTLPTPPSSHPTGVLDIPNSESKLQASPSINDSPALEKGIRDVPKPPPTDESSLARERRDQPSVNPTPAQDHVKSGMGVSVRVPGTAPAGGAVGVGSPVSPNSEISDSHDNGSVPHARTESENGNDGNGNGNGNVKGNENSSDGNVNGEGEKKEGRVKCIVHKVKDKITHHGH